MNDARQDDMEGAELAHWLQDAGRRKHTSAWVDGLNIQPPKVPSASQARRHYVAQSSLVYLFAVATVSFLIYYFLDVGLHINSMSGIIVFIRDYLSQ